MHGFVVRSVALVASLSMLLAGACTVSPDGGNTSFGGPGGGPGGGGTAGTGDDDRGTSSSTAGAGTGTQGATAGATADETAEGSSGATTGGGSTSVGSTGEATSNATNPGSTGGEPVCDAFCNGCDCPSVMCTMCCAGMDKVDVCQGGSCFCF